MGCANCGKSKTPRLARPSGLFHRSFLWKIYVKRNGGQRWFFSFFGQNRADFQKIRTVAVFSFFPHLFTQAFLPHRCGKPETFPVWRRAAPAFPQSGKLGNIGISGAFTQGFHRLSHSFSRFRESAWTSFGKRRTRYFSQISSRRVLISNSNMGSRTIFSCTHSCEDMMVE